jgi:hypothetical protein
MKSADNVREQLKNLMVKQGLKMTSLDHTDVNYYKNIKKCILEGFFMQVPILQLELIRAILDCTFRKSWTLFDIER